MSRTAREPNAKDGSGLEMKGKEWGTMHQEESAMSDTRIHPIWKEAAEKIADRVQAEGYGFMIMWEELHRLLEIKEARDGMTKREFDAIGFDKLNKIENLSKLLLEEHRIYLKNRRNKGYQVLTPKLQATEGFDHEFGKVRKGLNKTMKVMVHIDSDLLDDDAKKLLDRNLSKVVFVMGAANKRKLPPAPKMIS